MRKDAAHREVREIQTETIVRCYYQLSVSFGPQGITFIPAMKAERHSHLEDRFLSFNAANPVLGISPKERKTHVYTQASEWMFREVSFIVTKT